MEKSFKNPRRKSPRGPTSRKLAGNFSPASFPASSPPQHVHPASAYPLYNNYSQPPLLPLPRVNSPLPLQRANSSIPLARVNNPLPLQRANSSAIPLPRVNTISSSPARLSGEATGKYSHPQTQSKPVHTLNRTGSEPVGSYPVDAYPGPALLLLSPPPSSLPIPTFSMKPKLSCNAEAAAGDNGDNLRRLLRLR